MNRYLRKLAGRGMWGRRKDTRALAMVIVMSFLFLTAGTVLLASFTQTQAAQREQLYGSWHLLYAQGDPTAEATLQNLPGLETSLTVPILGSDSRCGYVAPWDAEFEQLGNLRILKGRAPEAEGEILLEKGRLGLFSEEITVGSTIQLTLDYHCKDLRNQQYPKTISIRGQDMPAEPILRAFGDGATEEVIDRILATYWTEENWSEAVDYINGYGERITGYVYPDMSIHMPLEEMDDETYRRTLETVCANYGQYFRYLLPSEELQDVDRTFFEGGTYGAVDWKLNTNYQYTYNRQVNLNGDALEQVVQERGKVPAQDLSLTISCTVVGIVETISDRWDVDTVSLPNCYISTPTEQALQDTVRYLQNLEKDPYLYHMPEESHLLFLRGAGSLAEAYEQALKADIQPVWEISKEEFYQNMEDLGAGQSLYMLQDVGIYDEDLLLAENAWELEQRENPELQAVTLEDVIPTGAFHYYCANMVNETGSVMQFYLFRPILQMELSDGSTREIDAWLGDIMMQNDGGFFQSWKFPFDNLLNSTFEIRGYTVAEGGLPSLADCYTLNNSIVLLNRYGFPMEGGLTETMGATIVGVILVITVCAVFQIFFTQLRRRTRKLTLLKSVGATNGQIFSLLAWECLYITAGSLLLGDALGFLIAWAVTRTLSGTVFYLDWSLFLVGQTCGILAVVVGMLLPSLRAMHTPLVGRMEGKKRRHVRVRPMKKQIWRRICARDRRENLGRTLGTGALCIFMVAMELICVFLGNAAFDTYRETVVAADKPDYTLTLNHAGSYRLVDALNAQIAQAEGLERIDFYRKAEHVYLWYEGMEDSPVLSALRQAGGDAFFEESQAQQCVQSGEGYLTEFYGVDVESDFFDRLEAAVTEGSVDREAFAAGEQVLVLMPMYQSMSKVKGANADGSSMGAFLESTGTMSLSLQATAAENWNRDTSIVPGGQLTLGGDNPKLSGDALTCWQRVAQVEVAGVIRYFPQEGIWPFAASPQSHVIIGSPKLLYQIYDAGFTTLDYSEAVRLEKLKQLYYPYNYGEACYNLYSGEKATPDNTLTPLFQTARENYLTLRNFRDSNRAVYDKALSACLLVGMLAFAATVIVWMILSNTLASAQEQSRKRTGILQALGVTKGQLCRAQAMQAVGYWLISLLAANLLLVLVILASGCFQRAGQGLQLQPLVAAIVREDLGAYPWALHGALCLLELPVLLLFHLRALKNPLRYSPVENIRS